MVEGRGGRGRGQGRDHRVSRILSQVHTNFSTVESPLTGVTKKYRPNIIKDWQDHPDKAFQMFKHKLVGPILCYLYFKVEYR